MLPMLGLVSPGGFLTPLRRTGGACLTSTSGGSLTPCVHLCPRWWSGGEGGHVVVTASAAGYLPLPSLPAYGTAKAGVLMLAQCLAGELAPAGVGVSAVCPGVVHTNITAAARFAGASVEEELELRARATEMYRRRGFGPEKVAAAVVAAIRSKRVVVPVTPEAKVGALAQRLAPEATRALLGWVDSIASRRS